MQIFHELFGILPLTRTWHHGKNFKIQIDFKYHKYSMLTLNQGLQVQIQHLLGILLAMTLLKLIVHGHLPLPIS